MAEKKRKRSWPKGPDIRDAAPTIVLFDSKLTFNGGSCSNPEVMLVWLAVKAAFCKAAFDAGLSCSWTAEVTCTTPERMQARIDKQMLNVEQRPASDTKEPQ